MVVDAERRRARLYGGHDLLHDAMPLDQRLGLSVIGAGHQQRHAAVIAIVFGHRVEVQHQKVSGLDLSGAGPPGRVARIGTRGDHGRRTQIGAHPASQAVGFGRHLDLGHAHLAARPHLFQHSIVQGGGLLHQRHFGRRLDLAQLDQQWGGDLEPSVRKSRLQQVSQKKRHHVLAHQSHPRGGACKGLQHIRDDPGSLVVGAHVVHPDQVSGRIDIESPDHDHGRQVLHQEDSLGRLLHQIDRLVTGQIGGMAGTVFIAEHDQRAQPGPLHGGPQPPAALYELWA